MENQGKDLFLLINKIEDEKGSDDGTEEQPQECSGTGTSLKTTNFGLVLSPSELVAPLFMNLRNSPLQKKSNHVVKCLFTSVRLFLVKTPIFQDLYQQPGCSVSTPAMGLSSRMISAIELHFILLHFRLGDITTGSVHSGKDFELQMVK